MQNKVTKAQVEEVLTESGPWTREQANGMAVQLLTLRGGFRSQPVLLQSAKKLGRYIWETNDAFNCVGLVTTRVNCRTLV